MANVEIIRCTKPAELHCHYNEESHAQPAFIGLDLRNRTMLAEYNAVIGDAVPRSVYYGFDRRYGIPILTAKAANRVMEEIAPLANRILDDWEEKWNGMDMVAVLGEDAKKAEAEIEEKLALGCTGDQEFDDEDLVVEWGVDSATNGNEANDYGITAETTDERLGEIEEEIASSLAETSSTSGVVVLCGITEYLRDLRNDMAQND